MHYLDSVCSRVGLPHKQTQPRIKSHRNNYERFVSLSNLASAYYYNCSSSSSRCTFKHWQLPEWWTPSHLPWRRSTVVQGHCPDLNVEPKINYATWLYCVVRMNGWQLLVSGSVSISLRISGLELNWFNWLWNIHEIPCLLLN